MIKFSLISVYKYWHLLWELRSSFENCYDDKCHYNSKKKDLNFLQQISTLYPPGYSKDNSYTNRQVQYYDGY